MMTSRVVRHLSTRSIVDKWFNALQSSIHHEQQTKLAQCIEYSLQQDPSIYSNLVKDIIHRWAIEQPTTEALWTPDTNSDEYQKLTYGDLYIQSSRLANILTGNAFNLTPGKSVLVILPYCTKERILIQLACLQSGTIFCSYDPNHFSEVEIRQQLRTSAIDCIITNTDNLEMITKCTYNTLRPLKKGIISHYATSVPLPIGWHHLLHNLSDGETKDLKIGSIQPAKRSRRHLTTDKLINQYSQAIFSLRQILTACWLNMNELPRLIWVKEDNDKISLAPWLLGSTIFYKKTDNIKTMLETFEKYPIDTFCASPNNYEMLDNQQQQQPGNTHLKQLLSTEEVIDPTVKSRWSSLTNLNIQDDCIAVSDDLKNKSEIQLIFKSYITTDEHSQFDDVCEADKDTTQIPKF